MYARLRPFLLVFGLLLVPGPARSAEADDASNATVVVRIKSVDELIAAGVNLYGQVGDKSQGEQFIDQVLRGQLGPKGLTGVDRKRPLGLSATLKENLILSDVVLLVPVTGQDEFLDLLERANLKAEKVPVGNYRFQPAGSLYKFPLPGVGFAGFVRFADRYAYITARDPHAISAGAAPRPGDVLPASDTALVTTIVRLDRLPTGLRDLAATNTEQAVMADVREKRPDETDAEFTLRKEMAREWSEDLKEFLADGRELTVRLDNKLNADITLTGRPGTRLARELTALGETQSRFAGVHARNAALQSQWTFTVPERIRRALEAVFEDWVREGLRKESDDTRRKLGLAFAEALRPTLKAGKLDTAGVVRKVPGGEHFTLVAGGAVRDGLAIDRIVHNLVKGLPADVSGKIRLDVQTVGEARIHRMDPEFLTSFKGPDSERFRKVFGSEPVYLAVAPDAVVIALGPDGLRELTRVVTAKPGPSIPFDWEIFLPQFGELVAPDNSPYQKLVKNLGRVRFTVEGGSALRVRVAGFGQFLIAFMPRAAAKP